MTFIPQNSDIIFKTIAGSKLYGLDSEDSDTDYRAVCMQPFNSFMNPFGLFETKIDHSEDDEEIHTFEKIIKLAAQCNPNIIELLFAPEEFIVITSKTWEAIREKRDLFISKEAEFRFKGYAFGQMQRAALHRQYLINPPDHYPTRAEFGLIESKEIKKEQYQAFMSILDKNTFGQIPTWGQLTREERSIIFDEMTKIFALYCDSNGVYKEVETKWSAAIEEDIKMEIPKYLGFSDDFIEVAKRERKYYAAVSYFKSYERWKKERNEKRAILEAKYGYDCKHISHTIRLLHMALEIGEGKGIIPNRKGIDDDFLKSIKYHGALPYDKIEEYVSSLKDKITIAFQDSSLRDTSDREQILKTYIKTSVDYWRERGEL